MIIPDYSEHADADASDLQSKNDALNLAGRHLRLALKTEGEKRRIYREEEHKFRIAYFISLDTKAISVKAYDEKKEMVLFQFKLEHETAKEVRNDARVGYNLCRENLYTLKRLMSIQ